MTMIERLLKIMCEYDIEYTLQHDIVIRTPIKPKDLVFIREYFKMYRIPYRNIIVESWCEYV